jgi:hypothetical protein
VGLGSATGQSTENSVITIQAAAVEENDEHMACLETVELQKFFDEARSVEAQACSRSHEVLRLTRKILWYAGPVGKPVDDEGLHPLDHVNLRCIFQLVCWRGKSQSGENRIVVGRESNRHVGGPKNQHQ